MTAAELKDYIVSRQGETASADEFCFWMNQALGTPCPAPESFGFVAPHRFDPVPYDTWFSRLSAQFKFADTRLPVPHTPGKDTTKPGQTRFTPCVPPGCSSRDQNWQKYLGPAIVVVLLVWALQ